MMNEFCIENWHKWQAIVVFTVPHFLGEVEMKLRCANCSKVIAGHIDLELDADRTLSEILGEFQDITGL